MVLFGFIIFISLWLSNRNGGMNIVDLAILWIIGILVYAYFVCRKYEDKNKKGGDD